MKNRERRESNPGWWGEEREPLCYADSLVLGQFMFEVTHPEELLEAQFLFQFGFMVEPLREQTIECDERGFSEEYFFFCFSFRLTSSLSLNSDGSHLRSKLGLFEGKPDS